MVLQSWIGSPKRERQICTNESAENIDQNANIHKDRKKRLIVICGDRERGKEILMDSYAPRKKNLFLRYFNKCKFTHVFCT